MADIVELDDGGVEVELEPEVEAPREPNHYENLVEVLDKAELQAIATKVIQDTDADLASRSEWEQIVIRGLDELGLKVEDASEPFPGACNAVHPLLIESVVKYLSKAITELFPLTGPVRTKIYGAITPEREARAKRVKEYMNYQVLEEIVEFYDETEKMLFSKALCGSAFKKDYWDPGLGRICSEFVSTENFVTSYNAPDLRRASAFTHIIYRTKEEIEWDVEGGIYADVDLADPGQPSVNPITSKIDELRGVSPSTVWNAYTLYERHLYLKLPDDKVSSPYIATVDKDSSKILSLRRSWKEGDARRKRKRFFTHFKLVPGLGFYGLGYLHLIGSLTKGSTAILRIMVDAGMFHSLQAGFKKKGIRLGSSMEPLKPGEFRDIEILGDDIRQDLMLLPTKELSPVFYQLLEFLVRSGQKFADSTEQVVADSTNYGPVGTTLALLESSTKFFTGIHKRLHSAFKEELNIIKEINGEYIGPNYPFETDGIASEDFKLSWLDVVPASDPNVPSNSHRLTRATTLLEMALKAPQLHNLPEIYKRVYSAMEVDRPETVFSQPAQPKPLDPLSDLAAMAKGQPVGAFAGQDHDSHIQVKTAFLEDPVTQGPSFQGVVPLIHANIRDHVVLKYQEVAQATGDPASAAQAVARDAAAKLQPEDPFLKLDEDELEQRRIEHEDDMVRKTAELMIRNKQLDIRQEGQERGLALKAVALTQKEKSDRRKAKVDLVKESLKNLNTQTKERSK